MEHLKQQANRSMGCQRSLEPTKATALDVGLGIAPTCLGTDRLTQTGITSVCDDWVLDKLYYNWTTDELNLFARLAAEINMFEPTQARYYPVNQRGGQCVEDPGTALFQFALTNLDEFEDLNVQCY